MIAPGNVLAVFVFEWRRALTIPRMAWWAVLTLFPVGIVLLIRSTSPADIPDRVWTALLFALVPMLISMLGTFLWTTTAISGELESKSWVYLAIRPNGSTAVLLGKFLAAITWVLSSAILGLSCAVVLSGMLDKQTIWWPMLCVTCLAVPSYASIYLFIGCVFPRRAMVIAIAYSLPFELLISFVPAVINKFTIQYRLRSLMVQWGEISLSENRFFRSLVLIGGESTTWHLTVLGTLMLLLLSVSIVVIRNREFSAAEEPEI